MNHQKEKLRLEVSKDPFYYIRLARKKMKQEIEVKYVKKVIILDREEDTHKQKAATKDQPIIIDD